LTKISIKLADAYTKTTPRFTKLKIKMETTEKEKKTKRSPVVTYCGFRDAFDNLPSRHRLTIRRECQKRMPWSPSSFYYKLNGETPIRENEAEILVEIFARFGLNPWSGEKIN